jgi:hypothetical protein
MNPFRWYFEHFDWGYKLVRAIGRKGRDDEYRQYAERTQQEQRDYDAGRGPQAPSGPSFPPMAD